MQVYDGKVPMDVVSKVDDSPVTAADIAAHGVILQGLQALTPDIPVLSEEAPQGWDERQHWQRYWLVDPLDGPVRQRQRTADGHRSAGDDGGDQNR
jgi:3'(2'), 5'-bisphosphate nucleotidase